MAQNALAPPSAAPNATSNATFSLGAHSEYTSSYFAIASVISVEGVPGYADTTEMPASYRPLATAALPSKSSFISLFIEKVPFRIKDKIIIA